MVLVLTGNGVALYSTGTISIKGGSILSSSHGICACSSSTTVSNATIKSSSYYAIVVRNSGIASISNSTIEGSIINERTEIDDLYLHNTSVSGTVMGAVRKTTITSTGYTVDLWGISSSATSVNFATWTSYNGQDDVKWVVGTKSTKNGNTCWSTNVLKSEHNNETGDYLTHIYWVNSAGTSQFVTGVGVTI
jgi:hypothetical protein